MKHKILNNKWSLSWVWSENDEITIHISICRNRCFFISFFVVFSFAVVCIAFQVDDLLRDIVSFCFLRWFQLWAAHSYSGCWCCGSHLFFYLLWHLVHDHSWNTRRVFFPFFFIYLSHGFINGSLFYLYLQMILLSFFFLFFYHFKSWANHSIFKFL